MVLIYLRLNTVYVILFPTPSLSVIKQDCIEFMLDIFAWTGEVMLLSTFFKCI